MKASKRSSAGAVKTRGGAKVNPMMVLLAVILVIAAVAGWMLWSAPQRQQAADLQVQIDEVNAQIATVRARTAALQSGEASGAMELLAQAQDLDAKLPAVLDKIVLAAQVPSFAAQHALTVQQLDPHTAPVTAGGVNALGFDVKVAGSRPAVFAFLAALTSPSNPNGLMTVSEVALTESSTETTVSFVLLAHFSPEPELRAPVQPGRPGAPDAPGGAITVPPVPGDAPDDTVGGSPDGTVDAGTVDAGTVDAGTVDAGTVDDGVLEGSGGTVDGSTGAEVDGQAPQG